jgi:hypothetical protein
MGVSSGERYILNIGTVTMYIEPYVHVLQFVTNSASVKRLLQTI